jgi:hypothetical protein
LFFPYLITVGMARSLPLEWRPIWCSSLALKYQIWMEVNCSGKHSSLLRFGIITDVKCFIMHFVDIYFSPSLITVDKARSLPLERSPIRCCSLALKYQSWTEVNGSGKHSSLMGYCSNYSCKKF